MKKIILTAAVILSLVSTSFSYGLIQVSSGSFPPPILQLAS
ncbi:hypothetical protein CDV26_03830 [Francisella halioticida]|uniref:Uncharacterized protein n=1 Tax=Francisella halioticida TaxID=549298 RepID=A0ABN5AZ54_9GAMM|nr:hypothetical protein [Francisella halioticida]ASG67632.1 hypothetical protein CDV26_03830 [Francisella halioticida]